MLTTASQSAGSISWTSTSAGVMPALLNAMSS
jgi:hypothetical protein